MGTTREMRSARIEVGGERFQVRTDLPEDRLAAIVTFIEAKLKVHIGPRTDPRRGLTLLALDLASDLFDARDRIAELEVTDLAVQDRAVRLAQSLDALDSAVGEEPPQST